MRIILDNWAKPSLMDPIEKERRILKQPPHPLKEADVKITMGGGSRQ
jgi:hypothetical protein